MKIAVAPGFNVSVHGPSYRSEGYALMAAAFEVYNVMGNGFLEEVYHQCLERELARRLIPSVSKPMLHISYKGEFLARYYSPDFIVYANIVVELKAAKALASEHEAQVLNYLKATRKPVGYLLNFGSHPKLEWRRFIMDHLPDQCLISEN